MKPLGRKCYKSKSGKHKCKMNGKHLTGWWEDVCQPNKTYDKELARKEIEREISGMNDDLTKCFPEITRTYPGQSVRIEFHEMVGEYCIYVNGRWSGYVEINQAA